MDYSLLCNILWIFEENMYFAVWDLSASCMSNGSSIKNYSARLILGLLFLLITENMHLKSPILTVDMPTSHLTSPIIILIQTDKYPCSFWYKLSTLIPSNLYSRQSLFLKYPLSSYLHSLLPSLSIPKFKQNSPWIPL